MFNENFSVSLYDHSGKMLYKFGKWFPIYGGSSNRIFPPPHGNSHLDPFLDAIPIYHTADSLDDQV